VKLTLVLVVSNDGNLIPVWFGLFADPAPNQAAA